MTQMARALNTTLFVKNGPSTCVSDLAGEGYLSYSIGNATAKAFQIRKHLRVAADGVMVDNLNIF